MRDRYRASDRLPGKIRGRHDPAKSLLPRLEAGPCIAPRPRFVHTVELLRLRLPLPHHLVEVSPAGAEHSQEPTWVPRLSATSAIVIRSLWTSNLRKSVLKWPRLTSCWALRRLRTLCGFGLTATHSRLAPEVGLPSGRHEVSLDKAKQGMRRSVR
jgi:hypothetical protein